MYADLSRVARNIYSIIPHAVGVEARLSLGRDVIPQRPSITTCGRLRQQVVVRQFARAYNGILGAADPHLVTTNTENDSEITKQAEERNWNSIAIVHDFLEMWQGSENPVVTQKECRAENDCMPAMGYISDTEEIVKASWSVFQHTGAAAFKLSERSPLPPPLFARDLQGL